jgi:hypothetical protein
MQLKDRFRISVESLLGICMCGGLTWYAGGATWHMLRALWSHSFWTNVGSSFHGVIATIGAVLGLLLYFGLTLVALLVTCTATLVALICLKRFFLGIKGRDLL